MYNHPQKIWSKILSWKMLKVLREGIDSQGTQHWVARHPAALPLEQRAGPFVGCKPWPTLLKGAPAAPTADLMILIYLDDLDVSYRTRCTDIRRYQKITWDPTISHISQSKREQKKRQHTCWRATIADKIDETANWAKHNSMGRGAWFVHLEARVKLSCENAQISDNFGPPLRVDDHYELCRDQEKNPFAANLHQKRMAEMF